MAAAVRAQRAGSFVQVEEDDQVWPGKGSDVQVGDFLMIDIQREKGVRTQQMTELILSVWC